LYLVSGIVHLESFWIQQEYPKVRRVQLIPIWISFMWSRETGTPTLLRIICRSIFKACSTEVRRAWNVLPQIYLSHNLLDLATAGGSDVDFAREVWLAAVQRARPLEAEVLHFRATTDDDALVIVFGGRCIKFSGRQAPRYQTSKSQASRTRYSA
jgi:hypothetical protein